MKGNLVQTEGSKYLTQQKYSEAITFYKQGIKSEPSLMSNYWYLCLALLLQGQELEARDIWLSVIEKADIEQVNTWTQQLVTILTTEAIRRETSSDFELASKMHGYATIARGEAWKKVKEYQFTTDWFTENLPIWERYLKPLANKPLINVLEIGSWEGMSTCWLLDNILTHESSRINCIDTFEGNEGSVDPEVEYDDSYLKSVEKRFDFNISKTGASEKVTKIMGRSENVLRSLPLNNYDLLYIDGSHLASDVLTDTVLGWGLVKVGGLIIFDDYDFQISTSVGIQNTKIAIDAFIKIFSHKINVMHKAHQVIIEKTLN